MAQQRQQSVRVSTKRVKVYYFDFDEAGRERWKRLAQTSFRKTDHHEVVGLGEIESDAASRNDLFVLVANVTTVGEETCRLILREKMGTNARRFILAHSDGPEDAMALKAAHFLAVDARSIRISLAESDKEISDTIHAHLSKVSAVEEIEG